MFRRLLLTAAAMLAARAAEPAAWFARYLGAGNVDVIEALIATSDGGELLGGYTFEISGTESIGPGVAWVADGRPWTRSAPRVRSSMGALRVPMPPMRTPAAL